ncbi:glycosylhydrolase-like jelly roll fold domain-containing protein [Paenibacillus sp. S-38]|uniref:glycosylhydrolase-like jelly roll fold domain-containing protein n=1 Tax=Paenibacillus sp. S-38 TaxID=3416710 RepID=UPI003CE9E533
MLDRLKETFVHPPDEFTPVPFWFWNDGLSKEEIIRQIRDFHAKEVAGFVLHPRMGLPRSQPYLGPEFLELAEAAVKEAAELGMRVILYDEGMYPSGAANGLVVKRNPDFASRGLQMTEYPCAEEGSTRIKLSVSPGERIIAALAVRRISEKEIDPSATLQLQPAASDGETVEFTPPGEGTWSLLVFTDTYSKGTIRGIHEGQDDGEADAPLAADLLNPEAVRAFIELTHERYYGKLGAYFGSTVIAMFTDEPDLLGRRHIRGLKPWTADLLEEVLAAGVRLEELPALWLQAGEETQRIRSAYEHAVYLRMTRAYYKPLYDWCEAHGIALTGHPAASDDIGLLQYFHIPGQDVVWRFIAPENDLGITGAHSTLGKCSADSARHRGRRRNLNEAFGVCGKESGWALKADEMKWYLDWLFVRGVNLISPHAFYYSIRDERRDERPPDVGLNNIWWPEYRRFSRYIKRMSWLMTDSVNQAQIAVLTAPSGLPWQSVRGLFERQLEFNYLEEELLHSACELDGGVLRIAGQAYRSVLVENGSQFGRETWSRLRTFAEQGGIVVEAVDGEQAGAGGPDIGQRRTAPAGAAELLEAALGRDGSLSPAHPDIRISHVVKEGVHFYCVVNEGEAAYEGAFRLPAGTDGRTEIWNPWTGTMETAATAPAENGAELQLRIERRECLVIAVDPRQPADRQLAVSGIRRLSQEIPVTEGWRVQGAPGVEELSSLSSWTEWEGMAHFSGTVVYEGNVRLESRTAGVDNHAVLDLGEAHELVRVWVNGREAGAQMWSPYRFQVGELLRGGDNELTVAVTNTLANRYDGQSLPSGLIGPVKLSIYTAGEEK